MNPPAEIAIRVATPSDAETLCEMIRALADYERLADQAAPSAAALARDLADDARPRCHAKLAVDTDGRSIGFALYYRNYSTFLTGWGIHLEDLFVDSRYRGKGVGAALLSAVGRDAVEMGCDRIELSVLDWNTTAIDFYLKRGACALDDWTTMRFTGAALRGLSATAPDP